MMILKRSIRLLWLPILMLSIMQPIVAQEIHSTQLKNQNSGVGARIKQYTMKIYNALRGNKKICSSEEIYIARFFATCLVFVVVTCFHSKYRYQREMFRENAERRNRAEREYAQAREQRQSDEELLAGYRETVTRARELPARLRAKQARARQRKQREAKRRAMLQDFNVRTRVYLQLMYRCPILRELPREIQERLIDIVILEPDADEQNAQVRATLQDYVMEQQQAQEPPIAHMPDDLKLQLKQNWNEWLARQKWFRQQNSDQVGINCNGVECFICMDEEHKDLARIPCSSAKGHTEKMCLDCLGTAVANGHRCPMCRAPLIFHISQ